MNNSKLPELIVSEWINTPQPIRLSELRGKVVVIEAFQMLCPGCVAHGLPLASRIAEAFPSDAVQVIGLHSVFEHHDVQGPRAALEAFVHEYRLSFPIAMDAPAGDGGIPKTMRAYQLQGTPSLLIVDGQGQLRLNHFGRPDDLPIGAKIMELIVEARASKTESPPSEITNAAEGGVCLAD